MKLYYEQWKCVMGAFLSMRRKDQSADQKSCTSTYVKYAQALSRYQFAILHVFHVRGQEWIIESDFECLYSDRRQPDQVEHGIQNAATNKTERACVLAT